MTKAEPLSLDTVRRRVLRSANGLIHVCMAMLAFSFTAITGMLVYAIFSDGSLHAWVIAGALAGASMVALSAARMVKDAANDIVSVVEKDKQCDDFIGQYVYLTECLNVPEEKRTDVMALHEALTALKDKADRAEAAEARVSELEKEKDVLRRSLMRRQELLGDPNVSVSGGARASYVPTPPEEEAK